MLPSQLPLLDWSLMLPRHSRQVVTAEACWYLNTCLLSGQIELADCSTVLCQCSLNLCVSRLQEFVRIKSAHAYELQQEMQKVNRCRL